MKDWRNLHTPEHLVRVTDAEVDSWRTAIMLREAPAQAEYEVEVKRYERHRDFVSALYPAGHAAHRLVQGLAPVKPRFDAEDFERFVKRVEEQRGREKGKADAAALHARAIVFLHQRGKTPGVDYDVAKAAEVARGIVCEEMIAKRVAAEGGFECPCDVCGLWDGEGNRCECGDRRCCWEHGGTFEDPSVYVVVY